MPLQTSFRDVKAIVPRVRETRLAPAMIAVQLPGSARIT